MARGAALLTVAPRQASPGLCYVRSRGRRFSDLSKRRDALDSRTPNRRTVEPPNAFAPIYAAANRQLSFGDKTMAFDANGNLTSLQDGPGLQAFTWDARDRLRVLNGPSTSAAFAYDGPGRRAQRTVNSLLTQFHYDGLDIVREVGGAGDASYLRSFAIDEALVRNQDTFFLAEALGSTAALTDPSGAPVTEYSYSPFGTTSTSGAPSANPFQYTGRENDGTGLYYYRARYYDPRHHSFGSEDPLGLLGGLNSFSYVDGNPLRFTDPLGLLTLGFSRAEGVLRVYDSHGDLVSEHPAANNTTNPSGNPWIPESHGPSPSGGFRTGNQVVPAPGGPNGSFGSGFLPFYLPPNSGGPGQTRTGLGVHAGRRNLCSGPLCGYEYPTHGCIRTTEDALDRIRRETGFGDRPRDIWIY